MCLHPCVYIHHLSCIEAFSSRSLSALSQLTVPCNHTLYASPTYTQKEPYIQRHSSSRSKSRFNSMKPRTFKSLHRRYLMHPGILSQVLISYSPRHAQRTTPCASPTNTPKFSTQTPKSPTYAQNTPTYTQKVQRTPK